MKHKKAALILAVTLVLALFLSACGGGGRDVNVDTDIFGSGGASTPPATFNGTTDGGSGGSNPVPGAGTTGTLRLEDALSQGVATQYERISLTDPQLGCEAIRSVVPSGWQSGGQVAWNMQSGDAPAVISFYALSPDGQAQSGVISNMAYDDPDPSKGLSEGQYDDNWLPKPVKHAQKPEDYMKEFLSGFFGVSDMTIESVKGPTAEQAAMLEEARNQMQAQSDATSAQANASSPYAQSSARIAIEAANVTMAFSLNGVPYKVSAGCVIFHNILTLTTQDLYNTYTIVSDFWSVPQLLYYTAVESVFEDEAYRAGADSFSNNLIINEQWSSAISQTSRSIFQQNAEIANKNFRAIQAQLQQQAQQIAAQSSQNYSSSGGGSGGYSSSVMDGATNMLTGQSYYEAPDGGSVLLDYNDYHYTDGTSIYSSSTPLNIGGTNLSELTDLGTMGGG